MMNKELSAFLLECGIDDDFCMRMTFVLQVLVKDTEKYHKLVSILNNIRLEQTQDGRESGSEPVRER